MSQIRKSKKATKPTKSSKANPRAKKYAKTYEIRRGATDRLEARKLLRKSNNSSLYTKKSRVDLLNMYKSLSQKTRQHIPSLLSLDKKSLARALIAFDRTSGKRADRKAVTKKVVKEFKNEAKYRIKYLRTTQSFATINKDLYQVINESESKSPLTTEQSYRGFSRAISKKLSSIEKKSAQIATHIILRGEKDGDITYKEYDISIIKNPDLFKKKFETYNTFLLSSGATGGSDLHSTEHKPDFTNFLLKMSARAVHNKRFHKSFYHTLPQLPKNYHATKLNCIHITYNKILEICAMASEYQRNDDTFDVAGYKEGMKNISLSVIKKKAKVTIKDIPELMSVIDRLGVSIKFVTDLTDCSYHSKRTYRLRIFNDFYYDDKTNQMLGDETAVANLYVSKKRKQELLARRQTHEYLTLEENNSPIIKDCKVSFKDTRGRKRFATKDLKQCEVKYNTTGLNLKLFIKNNHISLIDNFDSDYSVIMYLDEIDNTYYKNIDGDYIMTYTAKEKLEEYEKIKAVSQMNSELTENKKYYDNDCNKIELREQYIKAIRKYKHVTRENKDKLINLVLKGEGFECQNNSVFDKKQNKYESSILKVNGTSKRHVNTKYLFFDIETVIVDGVAKPYSLSYLIWDVDPTKGQFFYTKKDILDMFNKDSCDDKDIESDEDKITYITAKYNVKVGDIKKHMMNDVKNNVKFVLGWNCLDIIIDILLKDMTSIYNCIGYNSSNFDNFFLYKALRERLSKGDINGDVGAPFYAGNSLLGINFQKRLKLFDLCRFTGCSLAAACRSYKVDFCKTNFNHNLAQSLADQGILLETLAKNKDIEEYNNMDVVSMFEVLIKYSNQISFKDGYRGIKKDSILDFMTLPGATYACLKAEWQKKEVIKKTGGVYNLTASFFKEDNVNAIVNKWAGRIESNKSGGRVQVFERGTFKDLQSPDIKSSYPYVMICGNFYYPTGKSFECPSYAEYLKLDDYNPDNMFLVMCDVIDKNNVKYYCKKTMFKNNWQHDGISNQRLVSCQEIIHGRKNGVIFKNFGEILYWKKKSVGTNLFKNLIPYLTEKSRQDALKAKKSPDYNNAKREVCKGAMNSVSGKMGEKLHLDDTSIVSEFAHRTNIINNKYTSGKILEINNDSCTMMYNKKRDLELLKLAPLHLSYFIYSYSKMKLYEVCKDYNAIYCDTDSVKMRDVDYKKFLVDHKDVVIPHSEEILEYIPEYADSKITESNLFGAWENEYEEKTTVNYVLDKKMYLSVMPNRQKMTFKGVSVKAPIIYNQEVINNETHFTVKVDKSKLDIIKNGVCKEDLEKEELFTESKAVNPEYVDFTFVYENTDYSTKCNIIAAAKTLNEDKEYVFNKLYTTGLCSFISTCFVKNIRPSSVGLSGLELAEKYGSININFTVKNIKIPSILNKLSGVDAIVRNEVLEENEIEVLVEEEEISKSVIRDRLNKGIRCDNKKVYEYFNNKFEYEYLFDQNIFIQNSGEFQIIYYQSIYFVNGEVYMYRNYLNHDAEKYLKITHMFEKGLKDMAKIADSVKDNGYEYVMDVLSGVVGKLISSDRVYNKTELLFSKKRPDFIEKDNELLKSLQNIFDKPLEDHVRDHVAPAINTDMICEWVCNILGICDDGTDLIDEDDVMGSLYDEDDDDEPPMFEEDFPEEESYENVPVEKEIVVEPTVVEPVKEIVYEIDEFHKTLSDYTDLDTLQTGFNKFIDMINNDSLPVTRRAGYNEMVKASMGNKIPLSFNTQDYNLKYATYDQFAYYLKTASCGQQLTCYEQVNLHMPTRAFFDIEYYTMIGFSKKQINKTMKLIVNKLVEMTKCDKDDIIYNIYTACRFCEKKQKYKNSYRVIFPEIIFKTLEHLGEFSKQIIKEDVDCGIDDAIFISSIPIRLPYFNKDGIDISRFEKLTSKRNVGRPTDKILYHTYQCINKSEMVNMIDMGCLIKPTVTKKKTSSLSKLTKYNGRTSIKPFRPKTDIVSIIASKDTCGKVYNYSTWRKLVWSYSDYYNRLLKLGSIKIAEGLKTVFYEKMRLASGYSDDRAIDVLVNTSNGSTPYTLLEKTI